MGVKELLSYSKNLKVLYVEDEEISQELYTAIFEDIFSKIDVANDGVEAWEFYLNDNNYDLVISDVCMPRMDGVELSSKILNQNPQQLIIIMSAHNEEKQINVIKSIGINEILLKPVQNDELMSSLERLSKLAFLKKSK